MTEAPAAEQTPADEQVTSTGPVATVVAWWQRSMFAEESTASLAVIRIAAGLIIFGWAASVAADVHTFFGPDAVAPVGNDNDLRWSLLRWFEGSGAVTVLHAALVAASIAIIVGWHTRVAALVALVSMLSFARTNPWVFNSGDLLLRHLAFYLMLSPAGAALSVTALRRHGTPWVFPHRPAWPRRLIQVQLTAIYVSTVVAKSGEAWHDGTAVGYALRIEDLVRFSLPSFVLDSGLLVNLLTYGTLVVELALGVLIWNRKLRPFVLAAGVALHVGIDLGLTVGFFSYAMLSMYPAFIEPDTVERVLLRLRDRFGRGRVTERAPRAAPAPRR